MALDKILNVECSTYDFKESVEKKKTKSWLKSISAFANTKGGSLFSVLMILVISLDWNVLRPMPSS